MVCPGGQHPVPESRRLRSRVLVALRAVGHASADGRESFLSSIARGAAAHDAPVDWRRVVLPIRRSLGDLRPQPDQADPGLVLQGRIQALLLLRVLRLNKAKTNREGRKEFAKDAE